LDKPFGYKPNLIMAYIDSIDKLTHIEGPDSPNLPKKLEEIDILLRELLMEIEEKKMENLVDILIVSDHGMTKIDKKISLDELVPNFAQKVFVYDWDKYMIGITANIQPRNESQIQEIYSDLSKESNMICHLKQEIPERFHIKKDFKIANIFCYAKPGYVLGMTNGAVNSYRGNHGYDNDEKDMQGIFIAKGPSFKKGLQMKSFENIEVYNIMSKVLNLEAALNNGTFEKIKEMFN
jgi:ectonucleotide pyrophosphatase/phosphodiesterase family member 5